MAALTLDPPAPPPRRSVSTSCDLHPGETFTGFCAACLRERLSGLESSAAVAGAAPGRKSTSAIRSLFSRPFAAASGAPSCSFAAAEAPPDLRRCKSFSCGRWGGDAFIDEPQRRSCDVRRGTTLWALFHQDDRERVRDGTAFGAFPASSSAAAAALAAEVQLHPAAQPPPHPPVCVPEEFPEEEIAVAEEEEDSDEIIPVMEEPVLVVDDTTSGEVILDTEAATATRDVRAMRDHIDLESAQSQPKKPPPKDLKEIAGSFWLAASVFSKKWQKWRRKQKLKKQDSSSATTSKAAAAAMPMPSKPSTKPSFLRRSRFRGESELAGRRRSCDTDPRFSLDAGRMSVDDLGGGFSWDEPRASWDGYLFGAGVANGRAAAPPAAVVFSRLPPILSALEDSPAGGGGFVERSDGQIPVEEDSHRSEQQLDANVPGGSAQTRDYYMDSSSSRRRRSLDRAISARRSVELAGPANPLAARKSVEFAGPTNPVAGRKSVDLAGPTNQVPVPGVPIPIITTNLNGRESPLVVGSSEFYHFQHAEDLLDHHRFSTSSLVEDFSASFEAAFNGNPAKKPRRWRKAWSLWGLIHRRAAGLRRTHAASAGGDRAFSEPWQETMRARGFSNGRTMQRCNSNASARSSFSSNSGGGLGSSRRSGCHADAKRRRGEEWCGGAAALERNRSARYSPGGNVDNGMLRFYLTPVRSASGRRTPGRGLRSQSFARTMLRLY
ncbi:hypothetical protein PR202_ga05305 [Eleusine coracana subsp. coracana]|uniref:Uncharacterized protein n=1 Tax=Eleusine coracana subsp. coracana TaxID=191504 RepID=A0AAV5BS11_ELECO|nr:hypothetical protein QOZ80_5AG0371120 [Eleusine coracana subsp. coracana]GJM88751.1 hypothetical protein PR202_ga04852 [Eleusine coracana subsp. coracana]GJM89152.1 hypothetical protein PR202_ga05305 [Eleusine coracana subsp. coracana]